MDLVSSCIRALAAIALLAMGLAPVQAAVATEPGPVATASDIAHRVDQAGSVGQNSIGEFDLADHDCPPICPAGCSHSAGLSCCGSAVLATPSVVVVAISAAGDLPYVADQSLSGVEPDALQEPPQLSA